MEGSLVRADALYDKDRTLVHWFSEALVGIIQRAVTKNTRRITRGKSVLLTSSEILIFQCIPCRHSLPQCWIVVYGTINETSQWTREANLDPLTFNLVFPRTILKSKIPIRTDWS